MPSDGRRTDTDRREFLAAVPDVHAGAMGEWLCAARPGSPPASFSAGPLGRPYPSFWSATAVYSRRAFSRQIGQYVSMVFGAHLVLFSTDADADRRFLAEKLGMRSVDAGHGWLIFEMPPAEVAVHPAEAPGAELYLMCDDLTAEVESLVARGVSCSPVEEARWGSITKIVLPGGGAIGLYQPRHPLAIQHHG
jgi:hypothetical protein